MPETTPIADLSYRGYDGDLGSPRMRWWVIARMGIRIACKKKIFWWMSLMSGWYYWIIMAVLFFMEQFLGQSKVGRSNDFTQFIGKMSWPDQYFHGFSFGQMWYFILALILGAGAIANDNKANALLAYLSKPCSKLDYFIGKWMGVFIPLAGAMILPMVIFYVFGALSWRDYGFLSRDPWILVKYLLIVPIAAAFQTSLMLAVSSLFRQGQQAGAAYAALYLVSNFFTVMMSGMAQMHQYGSPERTAQGVPALLSFASVDGIQIAVAKALIGQITGGPFSAPQMVKIPAPNLWLILGVIVALSGLASLIAWSRIQAVEVVG